MRKEFSEVEFDAFLGVLILAGVYQSKRESSRYLWSTDESTRRDIFIASLSRNRFWEFIDFIRFDDKTTREDRRTDELAPREIWDL